MIEDFHLTNITTVPEKKLPFTITPKSKTFFIGSCFSENLYNKFDQLYLNSYISPFGNVYNPASIGNSLDILINNRHIHEKDIFQVDGLYQNFNFYSKLGHPEKNMYLNSINRSISESGKLLLESDLLIITLGTAWIYEKDGKVVNNCHKLPKLNFTRRLLTVSEIVESLTESINNLKTINKTLNCIMTLSPVRHLRDNPSENSLSKSLLRVGIEEVLKNTGSHYFPSYEIVLDELRDYRWYNKDLVHPNSEAVNYITGRFINSCTSPELNEYLKRINKVNSLINHKIINSETESSQKFIEKRAKSIEMIKKEYPELSKLKKIK